MKLPVPGKMVSKSAPLEHWDGLITFVHVKSFLSSGGSPVDNYLLI